MPIERMATTDWAASWTRRPNDPPFVVLNSTKSPPVQDSKPHPRVVDFLAAGRRRRIGARSICSPSAFLPHCRICMRFEGTAMALRNCWSAITPRFLREIDGAVLAVIVASMANMLQGWDNASMSSAMLYMKKEFNLKNAPSMEGSIVTIGLISAMTITFISGVLADKFGRRRMLLYSAISFLVGSIVTKFIQNIYMLLFTRFITGVGTSLAVTIVPLYISEIAHPNKRGLLNTFPQFIGSSGMFLSYCMNFIISQMSNANWRTMFTIQSIPSTIYLLLILLYLPESPKWLVRQRRVDESIKILQRLRKTEDVEAEISLLIEGTGGNQTPHIEEYLIGQVDAIIDNKAVSDKEIIKLYGLKENSCCIAYPINAHSMNDNIIGRSTSNARLPLDPIIDLLGSVNQRIPEESNIFNEVEVEEEVIADEENQFEYRDPLINCDEDDVDDGLYNPLLNGSAFIYDDDLTSKHESDMGMRRKSSSLAIGGGWQLAWKLPVNNNSYGNIQNGMQRMYIHQEVPQYLDQSELDISLGDKFIQAVALVNNSVIPNDQIKNSKFDLSNFDQSNKTFGGTSWDNILKPGVRRALIVAIGIQLLQQFAGINGVMSYTPQILDQAGVGFLLSNVGLDSSSASILTSAITTLMMLPFICIAMWLMDRTGRRKLLLLTIPILLVALIILVVVNCVTLNSELHVIISTVSVGVYLCVFVMGFGPIPNILCAEIFPTNVRAICSTIYGLTFWICDIIVTYSFPLLMRSIGLRGVFGIFATVCFFALIFVYCKVPETKGAPLEVISEFFSLGLPCSHVMEKKEVQSGPKKN